MRIFKTSITCMRNKGSPVTAAFRNRSAYSKYSDIRCRKLRGSLNITGIVILDSSYNSNHHKHTIICECAHTHKSSLVALKHTVCSKYRILSPASFPSLVFKLTLNAQFDRCLMMCYHSVWHSKGVCMKVEKKSVKSIENQGCSKWLTSHTRKLPFESVALSFHHVFINFLFLNYKYYMKSSDNISLEEDQIHQRFKHL